jgi:DNA ligase-1
MNTGIWYKKGSTGKMVQWEGWTEGNTFYVRSGQVSGKLTTTVGVVCTGKQGRSDSEQAKFQLNAKLNKKKDDGYLNDYDKALTHVVMLPMLAHSYKKRSHNISFPCIVQRKFDGVRCFAMPDGRLLSRKGKEFPHLNHLRHTHKVVPKINNRPIVFDGELYSDTMTFQEIVGMVKRETLKEGDAERMKQIKLRVYDCYDAGRADTPFKTRACLIKDILSQNIIGTNVLRIRTAMPKGWEIVENFTANNEDEIYRLQKQFIEEGYEGAMVRNHHGAYALGKRSANLQKVKTFLDGEYRIVGFTQGEGGETGCVIWKCSTASHTFNVRPKGTREQRRVWFNNGNSYINKMLTVKYQELTDDGIPRFPVGISVRDYE